MKKQKICIVGGNMSGLVTAICLSKLDFNVDLVIGNTTQRQNSSRTIAISENNFKFINKLNISESLRDKSWICSKMELYTENKNKKFNKIFELDREKKNIFYMLENSKLMKILMKEINKIKSISIKRDNVTHILDQDSLKGIKIKEKIYKYNLVILCIGHNSALVEKNFNQNKIENYYNETAISTVLNHDLIQNNTARQIFLDNSIFALLPISNTKTSIVWSIKNKLNKNNQLNFKKKIKSFASNYLKNIKFNKNIEFKNLNFLIRNKYFLNRTLLFGDALHVLHPFMGQGFNMTIRDLKCLENVLKKRINLGLDIGTDDVLSEFSNKTKPRNFVFSLGSNLLKNSIAFKKTRNDIFKIVNKSNFAKNIIFDIANKGLRF